MKPTLCFWTTTKGSRRRHSIQHYPSLSRESLTPTRALPKLSRPSSDVSCRGTPSRQCGRLPGYAILANPNIAKLVVKFFRDAEQRLMKGSNTRHHKLLVASKSLFLHMQRLAQHEVKDRQTDAITMREWKGEVDLSEFIPPVQAALSASLSSSESGWSRDLFPRHIPRMRALSPTVQVMSSKARPKKIKAYVVSADSATVLRAKKSRGTMTTDNDIGEIHFLVKREAKGDLRKDARVQDLNHVINRLMASSTTSDGVSARTRRPLRLRTFAVTCLSEDTGILEWVPDTASLRSLIGTTYNPQASPHSARRRGARVAVFGTVLRDNYERKVSDDVFPIGRFEGCCEVV